MGVIQIEIRPGPADVPVGVMVAVFSAEILQYGMGALWGGALFVEVLVLILQNVGQTMTRKWKRILQKNIA